MSTGSLDLDAACGGKLKSLASNPCKDWLYVCMEMLVSGKRWSSKHTGAYVPSLNRQWGLEQM